MALEDDRVSPREFTKAILDLQSLMTTLSDSHAKLSDLRHVSLRGTLDRLEEGINRLSRKLETHIEDDLAIEKRVTLMEEWQKRLVWIVLSIIPSTIVVWETVRRFVGAK